MVTIIVLTEGGNTSTVSWDELHRATWNPDNECEYVILGKLTGETYEEKKNEVRAKAIEFQHIDNGGLSFLEVCDICNYFETYGRRYGLLREFKENGIC